MLGFLRFRFVAPVFALALAVACSDPPDDGEDLCVTTGAPYELLVRVPEGSLPADLTLVMQYGGGSESFELAAPNELHQVLFCGGEREGVPGLGGQGGEGGASVAELRHGGLGGAGDTGIEKVTCSVYAESGISLEVTGTGYEPLHVELTPDVDEDCGVVSKFVLVELTPEAPAEEP
jgi:hypothetical protein